MENEITKPNWHARKRNWQTSKTREKIRDSINTGLIIKRFENHVLRNKDDPDYVELTNTQIKAGVALLDRTMPTLSSAEIVEQRQETGMNEAMQKLERLVGAELANMLLGKHGAIIDGTSTVIPPSERIEHKAPELMPPHPSIEKLN